MKKKANKNNMTQDKHKSLGGSKWTEKKSKNLREVEKLLRYTANTNIYICIYIFIIFNKKYLAELKRLTIRILSSFKPIQLA